MSGRVRSVDGTPLPGAVIDVWQADEAGFYDVQYAGLEAGPRPRPAARARGRQLLVLVGPADRLPDPRRRTGRRAARRPPAAGRCARRTSTSWSRAPGSRDADHPRLRRGRRVPRRRRGVRRQGLADRAVRAPRGRQRAGRAHARGALLHDGLRPGARPGAPAPRRTPVSASIETDVLIVGTGPAGGSAAVCCSHLRDREHRRHQVRLDGQHAARPHHQPADARDHARPRAAGGSASATARRTS